MAECMIFGKIAGKNAASAKDPLPAYAVSAVEAPLAYTLGVESDLTEETTYETAENEYLGKGQGIGGEIVVKVTMDGSSMAAIDVLETLPQAVLDAQSVDVDAVSGATTTSNAFFTAVSEALSQAQ